MKNTRVSHFTRRYFRALLAVALFAGAAFIAAISYATATSGTLTMTSGPVTYTHGPFVVPNDTAQVALRCTPAAAFPCDDFTLTINVPSGTDATKNVKVKVEWPSAAADFDLYVLQNGNEIASSATSSDPEVTVIRAVSGTYTVRVVPFAPAGQSYTATISLEDIPPAPPTAAGPAPRYKNYPAPSTAAGAESSGEPSIGVDWNINCLASIANCANLHPNAQFPKRNTGGVVFFTANLNEFRVSFDDCSSPAKNLWEDKTAPTEGIISLDPIGFVDAQTGRVFNSQLIAASSIMAFSSDDGETWTQSQGSGQPAGADHQTVGGGPYNRNAIPPPPPTPLYPNAVYYASQDIATALIARSDDGGLTFGPGVPMYNLTQCGGLHGHIKVGPDGTVYVPNPGCGGSPAVVVSTDNGLTWNIRPITNATSNGADPAVGVGGTADHNTLYVGYADASGIPHAATSTDKGLSWIDRDVSQGLIKNTVFPVAVGGDDNRAAFGFLGTPTAGNYQDTANFKGVWGFYVASTFDHGQSWTLVNATGNDPVQIGSICTGGTTCGADRNLLDFNEMAVDKEGRVVAAYADGCVAPGCTADTATSSSPPYNASRSALGSIIRQSGGPRLFAAYDAQANCAENPLSCPATAPAAPRVESVAGTAGDQVTLLWSEPDNGGSPLTGYNVYRRTSTGVYGLPLATITLGCPACKTSYQDKTTTAGVAYFYKVTAINAIGESTNCGEFPVGAVVQAESACLLPGITVVTDAANDNTDSPNAQRDVLKISMAEPFDPANSANKLFITLKVGNLNPVPEPSSRWTVFFTRSDPPPATTSTEWFVAMVTDQAGTNAGTPVYRYGHTTTGTGGIRTLNTDGTVDFGSETADGTITIAISKPTVTATGGLAFPALRVGETLTNINAITQQSAGVLLATVDSTGNGTYTIAGNLSCRPNTPPVAALTASPTSGVAPLTVSFDGSASSDPDTAPPADTIASYTFNFGDGSPEATQSTPTIQHTYNSAGDYRATLRVTDSRGLASSNVAGVVITVQAASNTPPVADLKANPTSGTAPLNVRFDASGSYDPDFSDTIAVYTFQFGDGTAQAEQGSPVVNHTYANPGTYTARVVVTDSRGASSTNNAQQTISVTQAPTPTPTPTSTPTPTATPLPKATPTVTTQASGGATLGSSISDTATLSGGNNPTGNVRFQLFGPDDATCGGGAIFSSTVAVNGTGDYTSASFTPTKPGVYRWIAIYSGDSANARVNTACNEANESVTVSATPTPTPTPGATPKATPAVTTQTTSDVTLGGSVSDTATLSGGSSPTGNVSFQLFGPDDEACGTQAVFTSTVAVSGAGNYSSASFTPAAAGTYRWVATYSGDSANNAVSTRCGEPSETVTVSAAPTPTPTPSPSPSPTPANVELLNISGRVVVQTGDNVGIGGFIISGGGTKRIMARALGPSLNVNGQPVAGRMADPSLEMHDANGGVLSNDNWRSDQEAEIQQSGLAPSNDKEAAIIKRLPAGNYTAIIRSADGTPGIGLIELFDLSSTEPGELGNLSVRALVQTDDNVLIDGVILRGGTAKRVLFRALGPELRDRGVSGEMQDPTLDLVDSNGVVIRSNDNWRDAPNASDIQGTTLAPTDDRESAILMTLSAGNYTSIVRGANRTTGIALNEVFKFDQ